MRNDVFENRLARYIVNEGKSGHYCIKTANESFTKTKDAYLNIKTKGDLSSFQWYEAPHKHWDSLSLNEKDENMSKVFVFYAALNFKDIMVSTGRIPLNAYPDKSTLGCLGVEFSGMDENGNRVCGVCIKNSIATTVMIDKQELLVFPVPDNYTLEEASTVPLVYLTVYYSLIIRGKLLSKETVLIHAGSGGVGQAALAVCLSMGCEVFTSVGTEKNKQFLKNRFPQLEDRHFVNSRDVTFEEHILKETNGRGVDVVLNSLAEEKLRASINCLADFGRFIEIGKYDIVQDNLFGISLLLYYIDLRTFFIDSSRFERNISFHVVCLAYLLQQFVEEASKPVKTIYERLVSMVQNGFKNGEITPLKSTVFSSDKTEEAFRFMASEKHVGKVFIKIRDEQENIKVLKPLEVTAVAQTYFHPSKVYLLIGGLGGIGLELGQWLVERGAKKLVFTSRKGIKNNYQRYRIQKLEKQGTSATVLYNDASTRELTLQLIEEVLKMGEIGGIFNLAMVLSDGLFENQTEETYRAACIPKVNSTLFLDEITRNLPLPLEYFVCFSSLTSGFGNAAQSNYGFANSVMETICEKRRADNLHGIAIQWGTVGDVGFILENFKTNDIELLNTIPQRIPSCMKTMDTFINSSYYVCRSFVALEYQGNTAGSRGDLLKKITHVLGISDLSTLDDNTTLGDLGVDSLMAVEIKQGLERDYNTVLSTKDIRQLTIRQIREMKQTNFDLEPKTESDFWSNFENPKELFTRLDKGIPGLPIFFIPPIEGDFKLMKPLVDHISRPVIGINWTDESDSLLSVEEVAAYYIKNIREKYPQPEYEFVAYSFGSMIALEMCVQLQEIDANLAKKLFVLDGDIDFMKYRTQKLIEKANVAEEIQAFQEMLIGFMSLIYPTKIIAKLRTELVALSTKDEKMKRAVDFINNFGYQKWTEELLKLAVQRSFDKLKMVILYEPRKKFKGHVKSICSTREDGSPDPHSNQSKFRQSIDGSFDAIIVIGGHRSFLTNNYKDIGNLLEEQVYYVTS